MAIADDDMIPNFQNRILNIVFQFPKTVNQLSVVIYKRVRSHAAVHLHLVKRALHKQQMVRPATIYRALPEMPLGDQAQRRV